MFTEADLKRLVPRRIFERGSAYYYEDNAVGRIRRTGDTFKAEVEGTETYRVELRARAGKPPKIYCDCPYDYGEVCKHGIALGLAVLEWFGSGEPERAPAELQAPAERDGHAQLLTAAWARTSDRQRLDYLRQLLLRNPKQLHRFLAAFEFTEAVQLAGQAKKLPSSPPPKPRVVPNPPLRPARHQLPLPPRRPPTLLAQAHRLIQAQKTRELLPLLLPVDWWRGSAGNDPAAWATVLAASAQAQPEATFDAVMERFEGYLNDQTLRSSPLYYFVATCLRALAAIPALTPQVQLFASELLVQYGRLSLLRQALTAAGFLPIVDELATGLPPKKRGRPPKAPAR